MSSYYIDTDLKSAIIYIAPLPQSKGEAYLIKFNERYKADNFLRSLTAKKIKNPIEDSTLYDLAEIIEDKKLGNLKIYVPLTDGSSS